MSAQSTNSVLSNSTTCVSSADTFNLPSVLARSLESPESVRAKDFSDKACDDRDRVLAGIPEYDRDFSNERPSALRLDFTSVLLPSRPLPDAFSGVDLSVLDLFAADEPDFGVPQPGPSPELKEKEFWADPPAKFLLLETLRALLLWLRGSADIWMFIPSIPSASKTNVRPSSVSDAGFASDEVHIRIVTTPATNRHWKKSNNIMPNQTQSIRWA